ILKDKYYFTVTARQDCSSVLAPGNKCSFFPSGAVRWRVSDEGFMANQSVFDDLSIRASYGIVGNASVNPYQTQGSLARTVYSFGNVGAFGYRPNALANPNLGWEKSASLDLGVEFGVLQNRLTGTIDLYQQNTRDLLLSRNLP